MKGQFDTEGFFAALDAHRLSKRLTWKQVAEESGLSASTLTRMAQGKRPDIDGLAALLKWSGLKAENFLGPDAAATAEPLAEMTALLRADPRLTEKSKLTLESVLRATYQQLRED